MPCVEKSFIANTNMEGCSAEWLKNAVDSNSVLLLDCRPQVDYCAGHIEGSMNVHLPTIVQRRMKTGNMSVLSCILCDKMKETFAREWKSKDIVLYDKTSIDMNANTSNILSHLHERLRQDGCKTKVLVGGYNDFQDEFPGLIVKSPLASNCVAVGIQSLSLAEPETPQLQDSMPSPSFPVEVIPNLYLGNAKSSMDSDALRKHNIKYILNVTPNLPNHFEGDEEITYKQIPINDHWSQNLSVYFPEAIAFIDEGRLRGCGVLVHCLAGISRSVTVTVAYLMSRERMSLNDAYDFVKKAKPNISPNFNFMGQLLDFEQTLQSSKTCICKKDCHCGPNDKLFFMTPTKTTPNYDLEPLNVR